MAPTPRPPALRGERRYLVKQRVRAVYRRVCAVRLFNEDPDHLGAQPCFCELSRDRSPPRLVGARSHTRASRDQHHYYITHV
jgi:hypothetical protein